MSDKQEFEERASELLDKAGQLVFNMYGDDVTEGEVGSALVLAYVLAVVGSEINARLAEIKRAINRL